MTLADAQLRKTGQAALLDAFRKVSELEIPFERTPGDGVFLWEYGASPKPGLSTAEYPNALVIVAISERQELLDGLLDSMRGETRNG